MCSTLPYYGSYVSGEECFAVLCVCVCVYSARHCVLYSDRIGLRLCVCVLKNACMCNCVHLCSLLLYTTP